MRRRLGLAVAFLGLCGVLFGAWAGAQLRTVILRGPPIASPSGLALAPDGTVFVGAEPSRIYAYKPDGRLRAWWPVEGRQGPFRLRFRAPDRLQVATEWELLEFDLEGELYGAESDAGAYVRFGPERDRSVTATSGERFEIRDQGLIRVAPDPPRIFAPPILWPLSLFGGEMVPVVLVLGAGVIAVVIGIGLTTDRARGA